MKKFRELIALTTVMALCAGEVQGQEYCNTGCANENAYCAEDSQAYYDCSKPINWCVVAPVGAAIVAAVVLATNHGHSHKHSGGGGGGGRGGRRPHFPGRHCRSSISHN